MQHIDWRSVGGSRDCANPALVDRSPLYDQVKSVIDRAVAGLGLILLAPVLAVLALAIRLDSDGPVIFRQERAGKAGRGFILYKFRTMRVACDDSLHRAAFERFYRARSFESGGVSTFKIENDPRVTRAGRFLRASSLDELPQLINVLKGEMSLVGPRPPILYETRLYRAEHWRRLEVRPGMTGLWQVSGRGALPFEEMVRLDLDYIARRSLFLDLKILCLTVGAVISGRGAG
ncbi:MAG TPA: sugar transferase [Chloroflexota bacterium]|nr:sugar transferase [Chloroflexota bacterium]